MEYKKKINEYLQLQGFDALQLRAVLFDMDGVLFDSMPYHADAWSKVMTAAGFNFSREDVYMNEGRTGADTINTASIAQFGHPSTPEQIEALCKAKCDIFATYPPTPRSNNAENSPGQALPQTTPQGQTAVGSPPFPFRPRQGKSRGACLGAR